MEWARGFDYHHVLGLYATFNKDGVLSIWNPWSGKVVAQFEDFTGKDVCDTLFLPGDRLAVSSSI